MPTPIPSPLVVGERVRIDRRWYRVASPCATVDGKPGHVLLTPLTPRPGDAALLALTRDELDAVATGVLTGPLSSSTPIPNAQPVQNPPGVTCTPQPQNPTADSLPTQLVDPSLCQGARNAISSPARAPTTHDRPPREGRGRGKGEGGRVEARAAVAVLRTARVPAPLALSLLAGAVVLAIVVLSPHPLATLLIAWALAWVVVKVVGAVVGMGAGGRTR